jgi:phosphatidate cytidylyltransferase
MTKTDKALHITGFNQLTLRVMSSSLLIPVVIGLIWLGGTALMVSLGVIALISYYEWHKITAWSTGSERLCYLIFGFLYISASLLCFFDIASHTPKLWLVMFLLLAVWLSDTGAYIVGKTFKGPKMAPALSPNKTWSGFVGACLFPALGLLLYQKLFLYFEGLDASLRWVDMILFAKLGFMTGVAGQLGDVSISYLKRKAGLKDTGRIIPGHGGILDRIDALLAVTIVFWIWMLLGAYESLFPGQNEWRLIWSNHSLF